MYEEIIAEIERIVKEILYSDSPRYDASNDNSWRNAVNDIMDIIKSRQQPSEDLDDEIRKFINTIPSTPIKVRDTGYPYHTENLYHDCDLVSVARHFAEWQEEQKSAGWSEEDEAVADLILKELEQDKKDSPDYSRHFTRLIAWFTLRFKSLRPQPHWKPSEEQMMKEAVVEVVQDASEEVDLEKVYDAYCKVCGHYHHTTPAYICRHACDYFKDFKELLNARKEDEK